MEEIFKKIQENKVIQPVFEVARVNSAFLKALIDGKNFKEVLINRIEKIESTDRAIVRKKHSKDIRDLFNRVYKPRQSVFNSFGGAIHNDLKGAEKTKVEAVISEFKGQKSLKKYLSESYFKLADSDPNGLIFLEYKNDTDIYPTYKSIEDIRAYESNGQLLKWVLFEPKITPKGLVWRYVDATNDYTILENNGLFLLNEEKSFAHPFGVVPAVILSDKQTMGSELRISYVNPILELAEEYARDKSIRTSYKFLHGFPRHWRYVKECRDCFGMKKIGDGTCKTCNGVGHIGRNDVTDIINMPIPREGENVITPNVEGFISPDLETLKQYNEDLQALEDLIDNTVWGTKRLTNSNSETATGRFIDVQPVITELTTYSDSVEWVCNQLIYFIESWAVGKHKEKQDLRIIFGKRFIIESQDVLLDKYLKSIKDGANNVILDKILNEYIYSKYQNDVISLSEELKKAEIEPYLHNDLTTVNSVFGKVEAEKKVLFIDFWEQCDKSKDKATLLKEMNLYFILNSNIVSEVAPIEVKEDGGEVPITNSVEEEAKARLKGSVGGVQGILEIQLSVSNGATQYDSALVVLKEIYGFEDTIARAILGKKMPIVKQPVQPSFFQK